jgi:tetratricopeptide (TPR) repeat protein
VVKSTETHAEDQIGWGRVNTLAASLNGRISSLLVEGNPAPILEPNATVEAEALGRLVLREIEVPPAPEPELFVIDVTKLMLVATVHYLRCGLPGRDIAESSVEAALATRLYAVVHRVAPGAVPVELRSAVAAVPVPRVHELEATLMRCDLARGEQGGDDQKALLRMTLSALPETHPVRSGLLSNLCVALTDESMQPSDPNELAEAVKIGREALRLATPQDPNQAMYLSNLCRALIKHSLLSGSTADLDEAVELGTSALEANSEPPLTLLFHAGLAHLNRYERDQAPADLDRAIAILGWGVQRAVPGDPQTAGCQVTLALAHRYRFLLIRNLDEIALAASLIRAALSETGAHTSQMTLLRDLVIALQLKFVHSRERTDGNELVAAARLLLETANGNERPHALVALGEALHSRFERFNDPQDNKESIGRLREARASFAATGIEAIRNCVSVLATVLSARAGRTESAADIEEALEVLEEAVELDPFGEWRAINETQVGAMLLHRFELTANGTDLDRSLEWFRRAERSVQDANASLAVEVHGNLGRALMNAYEWYGDPELLSESLRYFALASAAPADPIEDRSSLYTFHVIALRMHAQITGKVVDLDAAVALGREASLELTDDHSGRPTLLGALGGALLARYLRFGSPRDLDEGVQVHREAVATSAEASPTQRASHLANLSNALRLRFEQSGSAPDLEEAIEHARISGELTPIMHKGTAWVSNNLAAILFIRFARSGDPSDMNEAVEVLRSAIRSVPPNHSGVPKLQSNLSVALRIRIESGIGQASDNDEAIDALHVAIAGSRGDDQLRGLLHSNLSAALLDRHRSSSGGVEDLDAAAQAARSALRMLPADHPDRATVLLNLAEVMLSGADPSRSPGVIDEAFDYYKEATTIIAAPTQARLNVANAWITRARFLALEGYRDWLDALEAYRAAISELPLLIWHGLNEEDRLLALRQVEGLASEAAAVALYADRPEEALQLLEQGRGVLLAQALDARDEMSDLREQAPDLAQRIQDIRGLLDSASDASMFEFDIGHAGGITGAPGAEIDRRRLLTHDLDDLIREVRKLPGLEDFQRLPSIERLRAAAASGPVVAVNISALRCDAFIVTQDDIRTVPLTELEVGGDAGLVTRAEKFLAAFSKVGRSAAATWQGEFELASTLSWLWDVVAEPVLAALDRMPSGQNLDSKTPRLWWSPTGPLTLLPLHAAGHYSGSNDEEAARTVLDRYICSYTPTLRALAAAQGRNDRSRRPNSDLLAVDQSEVPGMPPLTHARAETQMLHEQHPSATLLRGPEATRSAVLKALKEHAVVHFAGHGSQNWDDVQSGSLYCHDHELAGPLRVTDISRLRLTNARLAFLSACETARGTAELPNEMLHLAGSLQLAGFEHVVAAQWSVNDAYALRIAGAFYEGLSEPETHDLDPDRASSALHQAIQRVRIEDDRPICWAAYIHTGP